MSPMWFYHEYFTHENTFPTRAHYSPASASISFNASPPHLLFFPSLSVTHTSWQKCKQTFAQLHTPSSSTFPSWVSYPQVFYYSDSEHYEPFSMNENRDIYPWKWDILSIWATEFHLHRAHELIRALYVGKRRYAYLRTKGHVHAIVLACIKWEGIL